MVVGVGWVLGGRWCDASGACTHFQSHRPCCRFNISASLRRLFLSLRQSRPNMQNPFNVSAAIVSSLAVCILNLTPPSWGSRLPSPLIYFSSNNSNTHTHKKKKSIITLASGGVRTHFLKVSSTDTFPPTSSSHLLLRPPCHLHQRRQQRDLVQPDVSSRSLLFSL